MEILDKDEMEVKESTVLPYSVKNNRSLSLNLPFSTTSLVNSSALANSSLTTSIAVRSDKSSDSAPTINVKTTFSKSLTVSGEELQGDTERGIDKNLISIHSTTSNPLVSSSENPPVSPSSSMEISDFGEDLGQNYPPSRSISG